ncbi:Bor/Iss family lipoprotein [Chitinophaga japonensis]|uniref:Bor protein n=1 Tax=Chitinophaga japonensis TaxID=104662 RepID=A0A562SYE9_CHIJA|nr:hypothetical protein [Chitinophaga japonensis]TWI86375.1 hypothetical protein LX66_3632 [Chitinophaga japonensis]
MRHVFRALVFAAFMVAFSSCYTYRVATHAQSGTGVKKVTAHSYFWGLAQQKDIPTPNCDTLGIYGMSEVRVRNNIGYALITIVTLGIYSPVQLEYKCGKPCPKTSEL